MLFKFRKFSLCAAERSEQRQRATTTTTEYPGNGKKNVYQEICKFDKIILCWNWKLICAVIFLSIPSFFCLAFLSLCIFRCGYSSWERRLKQKQLDKTNSKRTLQKSEKERKKRSWKSLSFISLLWKNYLIL